MINLKILNFNFLPEVSYINTKALQVKMLKGSIHREKNTGRMIDSPQILVPRGCNLTMNANTDNKNCIY